MVCLLEKKSWVSNPPPPHITSFFLQTVSEASSMGVLKLALAPVSALFHWMSQLLIDVSSKALLIQSSLVLVLFREIINCRANFITKQSLQIAGRTGRYNLLQATKKKKKG